MDVEALVRPVVEASGMELVEATFGRESGRRVLRITVDREGGVDLDSIALTSERIARRLDLEGFSPGPFDLEVTSPGVERPLRKPKDFVRAVGETVRVKLTSPPESFQGTLTAADDEGFVVDEGARTRRVSYADVGSARTVFDWGTA